MLVVYISQQQRVNNNVASEQNNNTIEFEIEIKPGQQSTGEGLDDSGQLAQDKASTVFNEDSNL